MKRKLLYSCLLLVILLMTGCTRYASASPTPATASSEEPKFEFPTPTLMALEVEVATRTPIPLILKTATPTLPAEEMLTTPAEGGEEAATGELTTETQEGEMLAPTGEMAVSEPTLALYKSPTPMGAKSTVAATRAVATQVVMPTYPPQLVLSGKPTVEI
ncbi:MAG: hypothetical protein LWX83_09595, partial [Anaerolineae bacterium]|nr:hypothetical protein [Anaerolineae bacterium]